MKREKGGVSEVKTREAGFYTRVAEQREAKGRVNSTKPDESQRDL